MRFLVTVDPAILAASGERFLRQFGFAKSWREGVSAIDLDSIFRQGRAIIKRIGRPKDLLAAKVAAAGLLEKRSSRCVSDALQALKPDGVAKKILDRWEYHGNR